MSRFTAPAKRSFSEDTSVILIHTERQKARNAALKKIAGEILIDQQIATLHGVFGPKADIILVAGYGYISIVDHLDRFIRSVINFKFDESDVVESIFLGLLATTASNIFVIESNAKLEESNFIPSSNSYVFLDREGIDIGAVVTKGNIVNFSYGVENKLGRVMYFNQGAISSFMKNYKPDAILVETMNLMLEDGVEFTPIQK